MVLIVQMSKYSVKQKPGLTTKGYRCTNDMNRASNPRLLIQKIYSALFRLQHMQCRKPAPESTAGIAFPGIGMPLRILDPCLTQHLNGLFKLRRLGQLKVKESVQRWERLIHIWMLSHKKAAPALYFQGRDLFIGVE